MQVNARQWTLALVSAVGVVCTSKFLDLRDDESMKFGLLVGLVTGLVGIVFCGDRRQGKRQA